MLLKLSTLAVVALLGFQTHAQLTVADVVDDIEKIDEVYDEAIDYLTSHGPDSADFNSRMDGYSGGLIDQYTKAIADARNVDLSIGDQLIVAKAMAQLDSRLLRFIDKLAAANAIDESPSAELFVELKNTFKVGIVNDLPTLDGNFDIGI